MADGLANCFPRLKSQVAAVCSPSSKVNALLLYPVSTRKRYPGGGGGMGGTHPSFGNPLKHESRKLWLSAGSRVEKGGCH